MQFNIEQLNIGKADNSTFNIQHSKLNTQHCRRLPIRVSMHLRIASVLPQMYLRYFFDPSSIVLRFPNEARTKDERRMNENRSKNEREPNEERTRTERRAIEKQSRTDRRINRSITLHYRLVSWISISFHFLEFLGVNTIVLNQYGY